MLSLVKQPCLLQTAFTELTVDTSTTSVTFVDLMSLTISTTSNSLIEVHFTVSTSTSAFGGALAQFALNIDGSIVIATHVETVDTTPQSDSIVYATSALSSGTHVFKIQWLRDVGTQRIRPVSTIREHASLLVREIIV